MESQAGARVKNGCGRRGEGEGGGEEENGGRRTRRAWRGAGREREEIGVKEWG